MGLIAGAQLMVVLDITIVNIALPSISRALSINGTSLAWIVDAYTLVFGGLLLLGGRAGDIFGRRRMFLIGISIFAGASFLGGLSNSEVTIIAARVIQGIGGAIASPTALALIATNFPQGKDRNEALGIVASVSALGASLGLIFGAVLTQYLSWRWVFFVNTPVAVVIGILAPRHLKESPKIKVASDIPGSFASVIMIGALVYGLINSATYGWTSTVSLVSFVSSVLAAIFFFSYERKHNTPILDLSIFSNRNRSGSYAIMFLIAAALFSLWFFLTQYLQIVLGYSPLKTGFAFLPMTLTVMILTKVGAKYVKRVGSMPFLVYGPAAVSVALFFLGHLGAHSSYLTFVLPILLLNATGIAATFSAVLITVLSGVSQSQAGLASSMVSVSQQVGGTLGISILVTVSSGFINETSRQYHVSRGAIGAHALQILSDMHGWTAGFTAGSIIAFIGVLVAISSIRRQTELVIVPIIGEIA